MCYFFISFRLENGSGQQPSGQYDLEHGSIGQFKRHDGGPSPSRGVMSAVATRL